MKDETSGRRGKNVVFLNCLLVAGIAHMADASDDPLEDYLRACEAASVVGGVVGPEVTCSALVERLSALTAPAPEARLALVKARAWLGHYPDEVDYCNAVRSLAEDLADSPDVLYTLAICSYWPMPSGPFGIRRGNESLISGLQATLALAPDHEDALDFLVYKIRALGYGYGVDAAALTAYATTLYEITGRLSAAEAVFAAALDANDPGQAEAIRERVRRDLNLDALDYGPEHRRDSLQRSCGDESLFYLDLEGPCLDALRSLARSAADAGEAIPDDVLDRMGDVLGRLQVPHVEGFRYKPWKTGPKTGAVAGLKAVLGALPEPLRSSEHYRVYARTAADWADRIGPLRRAVDLDSGNFTAQCDLANALAWTGERDEARSFYMHIKDAATAAMPCDFESALLSLDEVDRQDEMRLRVSPAGVEE